VHLPVLAISRREVFVPTLFAYPGQQPIALQPSYAALADAAPPQLFWAALTGGDTAEMTQLLPVLQQYDYIALTGGGPVDLPPNRCLAKFYRQRSFQIFATSASTCAPALSSQTMTRNSSRRSRVMKRLRGEPAQPCSSWLAGHPRRAGRITWNVAGKPWSVTASPCKVFSADLRYGTTKWLRYLGATPLLKGQDAGGPGRAAPKGATRAEAISGRAAHRNDRA